MHRRSPTHPEKGPTPPPSPKARSQRATRWPRTGPPRRGTRAQKRRRCWRVSGEAAPRPRGAGAGGAMRASATSPCRPPAPPPRPACRRRPVLCLRAGAHGGAPGGAAAAEAVQWRARCGRAHGQRGGARRRRTPPRPSSPFPAPSRDAAPRAPCRPPPDEEDPEARVGVLRRLLGGFDEEKPPFIEPPLRCDYVSAGSPQPGPGPVQPARLARRARRAARAQQPGRRSRPPRPATCLPPLLLPPLPQGYNITVGKDFYANFNTGGCRPQGPALGLPPAPAAACPARPDAPDDPLAKAAARPPPSQVILDCAAVTIGDRVLFGPNVQARGGRARAMPAVAGPCSGPSVSACPAPDSLPPYAPPPLPA
jgi:hypothetical protein